MIAPMALDGPISGDWFEAYVSQILIGFEPLTPPFPLDPCHCIGHGAFAASNVRSLLRTDWRIGDHGC